MPKLKANGTSRLHEFVDIGVPGTVSTRRAACHMCLNCWAGNRRECDNIEYTGQPTELTITREHEPVVSISRVTRSQLDQDRLERAARAVVDSNVSVETHNTEQTVQWVVGKVMLAEHRAAADSPAFEEGHHTIRFDSFRAGDFVLVVCLS